MLKTNVLILCLLAGTGAFAIGQDGPGQFKTVLNGYNEVPSVLTTGSGQLTVSPSQDGTSLSITLTFTKLVGVAHSAGLYLGLPGVTGGLIAPICGGTKPSCPTSTDAPVTTTIVASDVVGISAQGLAAGDIAAVIQALTNGAVYVNILTSSFTTGEIRGQLGRAYGFGLGAGGGRSH